MPDQQEDDTKKQILKALYEAFHKEPLATAFEAPIQPQGNENLLEYVAERYDGTYWDLEPTLGMDGAIYGKIRGDGIQLLRALGHPTILDDDARFHLLVRTREQAKSKGTHVPISVKQLAVETSTPEDEVLRNVSFLAMEGLVKMDAWGRENVEVRITQRGMESADAFELHGGEPPEGHTPLGGYQHFVGPNDRAKAEQMFRDQVELARKTVTIIDPYARTPLFDWLKHVPAGVKTRVLTSDKVIDAAYVARVLQEKKSRDLEVRWVPYPTWGRHGRFLIRDETDAWSWDASFHDAGEKRHPVTELAPVNRQNELAAFTTQWAGATEIK